MALFNLILCLIAFVIQSGSDDNDLDTDFVRLEITVKRQHINILEYTSSNHSTFIFTAIKHSKIWILKV